MTPLMGDRLAAGVRRRRLPARCAQRRARRRRRRPPRRPRRRRRRHVHRSTPRAKIHAASHLGQRLQLELGGKNPVVVLADADLDAAADVVARSSFSLSGQACTGAGGYSSRSGPRRAARRGRRASRPPRPRTGDRHGVTMGPLIDEGPSRDGRRRRHGDRRDGAPSCARRRAGRPAATSPRGASSRRRARRRQGRHRDGARGGVRARDRLRAGRLARRGDRLGQRRATTGCRRRSARARWPPRSGSPPRSRPGWCGSTDRPSGAAFNAPFGGVKQSGTGTHREQLGPTVMDFYTVVAPSGWADLMDLGLEERPALVLGSSSGLGRAVAATLVAEGRRWPWPRRGASRARRLGEGRRRGLAVDLTEPGAGTRSSPMPSPRSAGSTSSSSTRAAARPAGSSTPTASTTAAYHSMLRPALEIGAAAAASRRWTATAGSCSSPPVPSSRPRPSSHSARCSAAGSPPPPVRWRSSSPPAYGQRRRHRSVRHTGAGRFETLRATRRQVRPRTCAPSTSPASRWAGSARPRSSPMWSPSSAAPCIVRDGHVVRVDGGAVKGF